MLEINKHFVFRCTKEERELIKLLTSQLKVRGNERVAEVMIRALEKLKEDKE